MDEQASSSSVSDSLEGNMETIKEEQLDIVIALTTNNASPTKRHQEAC
jgi:hypothetical protein